MQVISKFINSSQNFIVFTPKLPKIVPKGGAGSAWLDNKNVFFIWITLRTFIYSILKYYNSLVITPAPIVKLPSRIQSVNHYLMELLIQDLL